MFEEGSVAEFAAGALNPFHKGLKAAVFMWGVL